MGLCYFSASNSYAMQNMALNSGAYAGNTATSLMAAEEIRVDCVLLTSNGRYVVTGSLYGPPQVWDMKVSYLYSFFIPYFLYLELLLLLQEL